MRVEGSGTEALDAGCGKGVRRGPAGGSSDFWGVDKAAPAASVASDEAGWMAVGDGASTMAAAVRGVARKVGKVNLPLALKCNNRKSLMVIRSENRGLRWS